MTGSTDLVCALVLICLVSTTGYSDEQPEVLPADAETHRSDLLSGLLMGLEGTRRFDHSPPRLTCF